MKLSELRIRDFKGIHDLWIDFGGRNMNIYGENGTGKTTVYDAFLWLMFDRDSTGRRDFAAKPRGRNGEEIHHLKTQVEGRILQEGKIIVLRKKLLEKWTKKRGESVRTYTGNETEYSVDGVPCSKGEFQAAIAELIDEETFRIITSPEYFNTAVSWQERRDKLFALAGYLKGEDEMVALLPEFEGIREILRGRSTEEAKKAVQFSLKKLKEEMQDIPVRMDEIKRSMPERAEWGELERLRDVAHGRLEETERRLLSARELARATAERLMKAETLRTKLKERDEAIRLEAGRAIREAKFNLEDILMQISAARRQMREAEAQAACTDREAESRRDEVMALQKELDAAERAAYAPSRASGFCETCGQALPEKMARREEDERKKEFAARKGNETAALKARMEENKSRLQETEVQAKKARRRAEEVGKTIAKLNESAEALRIAAEREVPVIEPAMDAEYCRISSLLAEEEANGSPDGEEDIQFLLEQKNEATDEMFRIEKKLAVRKQFEAAQKRRAELSREMEKLLWEAGAKERILADLEKFTAYKCSLMENKINSMFKGAKWKLFDMQINGGVGECCECLIGGVPYSDANSAARINAGLEIIDVFSQANSVSAPIFIDNRESIGEMFPVRAQVVSLIVTGDMSLRAEPADCPAKTGADWLQDS